MFTLIILKLALHGPIYRKLPVEILEATCYINIIVLSFATFYTLEAKKDQFIVAYISVTATIALFFTVFIYHMFTEMCSKTSLWKKLTKIRINSNSETENSPRRSLLNYHQVEGDLPQPTVSWLDAPQNELSLQHKNLIGNEIKTNKEISPLTV